MFENCLGVSPMQYLQTRRLLNAKLLLTDTRLPIAQVARLSGFASERRFHTVFAQQYQLRPTAMRKLGKPGTARDTSQAIALKLAYRPDYDVPAMLQFFAKRQIAGLEQVSLTPDQLSIGKTLTVHDQQHSHSGWLQARFDTASNRVELQVSESLGQVVPQVIALTRALLDLDAHMPSINAVLNPFFPGCEGMRLPGCLDGFEMAIRAVLGQQITVAAARTLTARLVAQFGTPLAVPVGALNRLFPSPQALSLASGDALGQLGIVKQRQAAILAIANAVAEHGLELHAGADVPTALATLKALPGVGDWTAQYIAMRALRWPDAFPAGDVALHKALGLAGSKHAAQEAQLASKAWQPWRSYAVIRAWASLGPAKSKPG
jgi:AraC family transcriptional regulator of adaptative response / DNA-3-methyladenine glycosylase II